MRLETCAGRRQAAGGDRLPAVIGIYVFAACWISLAVGILLFALIKGRKGSTGPTKPASRNRMILTFGFIYVAIGLLVPAWAIADSHNSDVVRGEGIALNSNQKNGQALFGQLCAGCHRLASANAQGRVGPNLDVLLAKTPATDAAGAKKNYDSNYQLVYTTIINGVAPEYRMPALVTQGQNAKDIAAFVAATAGYANP